MLVRARLQGCARCQGFWISAPCSGDRLSLLYALHETRAVATDLSAMRSRWHATTPAGWARRASNFASAPFSNRDRRRLPDFRIRRM